MTDQERLAWLEAEAEKAYAEMYGARHRSSITACYSGAKECLYDAIALAGRLGREADAERLARRLANIKGVFRSQFANFT